MSGTCRMGVRTSPGYGVKTSDWEELVMLRRAKRLRKRTKDAATLHETQGPGSGGVFGEPPTAATDAYFGSMSEMQIAIAEHDYETAAVRAREMLAVIPAWVAEEKARAVWEAEQQERWGIGQQAEPDAGDVPLLPPSIPVLLDSPRTHPSSAPPALRSPRH